MTISNDRLDRIEATLEKLANDMSQMREEQRQMREEQGEIRREQSEMRSEQDRGRKWEDRTWDVIKWVGGISAALSISAAIALVGLVIRLSLSQ
jgi:chromosome segregation ATPase